MALNQNFCNYLETEANCAPFTTAHGPSTPCCDKYMNNKCGVFNELYKTQNPFRSCFNESVGKEYICPTVSPGGINYQPLNSWFKSQQCGASGKCSNTGPMSCHHQNPNIGVHELCPYKERYTSLKGRKGSKNASGIKQKKGRSKGQVGGGCGCESYCRASYGPDYFNLAALGLQGQAYKPDGSMGCANNPMCGCGPNCSCGPSCNCGQNNDIKNNKPSQEGGNWDVINNCQNVPRDAPYSCQNFQCRMGAGGCPEFDSTCNPSKSVYEFVCGNSTRCGNGDISAKQGCGCDCAQVIPKIWDQAINPNRTYGITQPEEVPGYYLDVSQPPIGNRPVQVQSDRETIPSMLLCNNVNLPNKCFGCKQPCWNKKCI